MALPQSIQLGAPHLDPTAFAGTASAEAAIARLPRCEPLYGNRVKRGFDIVGALGLLLLFGPLMLAIAWLIARDGGPALFGHTRVGADGRPFKCLKFRSMLVDADEAFQRLIATDAEARAEWLATRKLRNDPRITGIGRFLRRSSLDELPQLINVLRGEMSLVGPRPLPAYHIRRLDPAADRVRQRVRPGITGLWQVSGRSAATLPEQQRLDTYYVRNWSLWLDIHILCRTVLVVLSGRGAW